MGDLRGVRTQVTTQVFVLDFSPPGAPVADLLRRPPGWVLTPESIRPDPPRGDQDVGMEVALVALFSGPVHGDVGDHAARHHMLGDEVPDQGATLLEVEFVG